MEPHISLKAAERKVFQTSFNDGLWDIFLGCVFLMFVTAPYLSPVLGDFWSSTVFLPFWALFYLAFRLIRKHVVTPRVGVVKFGVARQAKLTKFTVVLLSFNILAFILGLVAALRFDSLPGGSISLFFGLILLMGFSLAAYLLDFQRLYLYGLLLLLVFPIGEWLWAHGYAAHHGFPITFGTISAIMIATGLALFIRLLHDNPIPIEGFPSEDALNG